MLGVKAKESKKKKRMLMLLEEGDGVPIKLSTDIDSIWLLQMVASEERVFIGKDTTTALHLHKLIRCECLE